MAAISILFIFLFVLLNSSQTILTLDAPTPWQIGFQDGASPGFEGIVTLHDYRV